MDLKLSGSDDLAIEMGGLVLVDGVDAIAQDVRTRLRFFKGEWFLDERVGLPYYGTILVKNPNMAVVKSIYQKAIATTPGVESVTSLDLSLNIGTRTLRITFQAVTVEGPLSFDEEMIL